MDFWQACKQLKNQSSQQWQHRPSLSGRRITLEEAVQHYIQVPNCYHKSTQAVEEFDRPSPQQWLPPQQWPSPQQWQQQPFLSGSLDRLDDTLQRFLKNFDATQKSIEESCKRMEMQLRYISQRLNDEVNTEVNPKEEGQTIVTESDKILDEKELEGDEEKIERKEKEELSEKNKDEEKEKEVVQGNRAEAAEAAEASAMEMEEDDAEDDEDDAFEDAEDEEEEEDTDDNSD
ncbi:hypothetical protein LR48_Vigan10g070700 [Vigna angularis]|uniref:Uncharacterized protein n=1 Tax=Phaseolus angularis TaxID=3914 RepID=A0A0L9VIC0_PHAAN|nr:hypothetical protein LR48_Vigan10g070700 [Vigna angularis]